MSSGQRGGIIHEGQVDVVHDPAAAEESQGRHKEDPEAHAAVGEGLKAAADRAGAAMALASRRATDLLTLRQIAQPMRIQSQRPKYKDPRRFPTPIPSAARHDTDCPQEHYIQHEQRKAHAVEHSQAQPVEPRGERRMRAMARPPNIVVPTMADNARPSRIRPRPSNSSIEKEWPPE